MDLTHHVYLDGDEKPVAAFRYQHHAEAWAEEHAGRCKRSTLSLEDERDGLDPYRVKT